MNKNGENAAIPARAMVFAAGLGTRMRPVTDTCPKPLVRAGGKALIDYTLDRLAEAGVREAIVNVHYLPDQIIEHVRKRTSPGISISDEREKLLDQGGGIAAVLDRIGDEPFFVCNTDAFWIAETGSNLVRMGQMWDPDEMDILLLLAPVAGSIGVDWSGDFFMQPDGRLSRRETNQIAPFVYAGIAIMKPALFAVDNREIFPLSPILFAAAQAGRLFGMRLDGQWLHVGTPQALNEANALLQQQAGQQQ